MKVLIISSSPRKGGNSDTLCNSFAKGAVDAGHSINKIFLKDKKINYCTGCGFCNTNNYTVCSQKDDMAEILNIMIDSDVIVFATPVYFYTMCGQMKTFIDRCCSRYTHILNKKFYYIITAADDNKEALNRTVEEFRGFLDCIEGAEEKGILYGSGVWEKTDVENTPYINEAYEMGKSI